MLQDIISGVDVTLDSPQKFLINNQIFVRLKKAKTTRVKPKFISEHVNDNLNQGRLLRTTLFELLEVFNRDLSIEEPLSTVNKLVLRYTVDKLSSISVKRDWRTSRESSYNMKDDSARSVNTF